MIYCSRYYRYRQCAIFIGLKWGFYCNLKLNIMKFSRLILLFAFICSLQVVSAQEMRRAFILGENEQQYDQLRTDFARTYLTVFDYDQERALTNWFKLLQSVEGYAEKINFELNGLKLYLNVFWNEDGSIAHIGILPMQDSKNVKSEDVVAFFSSFIRQYVADGPKSSKKFSHYTSVSFPTFAKRTNN